MLKNILVVDDEGLVIESLKKLLKKEGFNAIIARSGEEAIKKIQETTFSLIIMDVMMPGIDGVDALKNIRDILKEKNEKMVPEIIMTGYSSDETFKKIEELKVADCIYKPFDVINFLEIIRKNLK